MKLKGAVQLTLVRGADLFSKEIAEKKYLYAYVISILSSEIGPVRSDYLKMT